MSLSIIILANGDQSRFPEGSRAKQLLTVDGDPVIVRAVLEFHRRLAVRVKVVTGNAAIVSELQGRLGWLGDIWEQIDLGPTSNQLATLALAHRHWGERTICLLGDVYYSDAAVEIISGCQKPVAFYGRRQPSEITGKPWGELVAMAWERAQDEQMLHSLLHWTSRPLLWSPYRDFAGIASVGDEYELDGIPCFTEINDWTEDFDFPADHEEFMRRRAEKA